MAKNLRRYRNRKLYDPDQGYVGLQDVVAMVRRGEEVTVKDHTTGEDRTGHVLAQALAQEELRSPNPSVRSKLVEALRLSPPLQSQPSASGSAS